MKMDNMKLDFIVNGAVVKRLPMNHGFSVAVIGDRDNGLYEWVLEKNGDVFRHSNDGFFEWDRAMVKGIRLYQSIQKNNRLSVARSVEQTTP